MQGDTGATGATGADGLSALIKMSDEPSSTSCPAGGKKIEIGLDANKNQQLDASEVSQTGYVCNASRARVAFITSLTYSGNLGGLAGADLKCQTLANA